MSAHATAHTGNNSMKAGAEVWQVKGCGMPAHAVISPQLLFIRQSKRYSGHEWSSLMAELKENIPQQIIIMLTQQLCHVVPKMFALH